MTIRFDDAWTNAQATAQHAAALTGRDVVLVRDVVGRVSLAMSTDGLSDQVDELSRLLHDAAGAFTATTPVLAVENLFNSDSLMRSPDLVVRSERASGQGQVSTLERGIVGGDWARPAAEPTTRRAALYGFKGGVGRSTATFMLAQHLAAMDKCVLVVDLDLESPGIGALLQSDGDLAEHGVVDHLVEAAVGNADDLDLVSRSGLAQASGGGSVWLASASGRPRDGYDYMAKLNRIYSDLPPDDEGNPRPFSRRLAEAVEACEKAVALRDRNPDVVLLDSRAGLHDIAAIAITQLATTSLLFAADTPQTWAGYRSLFAQWQTNIPSGKLDQLRKRLRMVASMVSPSSLEASVVSFSDHSQECFASTLYDDEPDDASLDTFNFAPNDYTGPHFPLPITFSNDLVGLDPQTATEWHANPLVRAAYEQFLPAAADLIFAAEETD